MIRREILSTLREHLAAPEISMISGARQVGKTTLMNILQSELRNSGKKVLFLSMDYDSDKPVFHSQEYLIQKIRLEFGDETGFVFIDEIQRKENAGLFLKGIYDRGFPWKFILSGSGSIELKEKIAESLAGRKRIFEVMPVSWEEFLHFKTGYQYENRLADYFSIHTAQSLAYLNEYLNFGGYPRVILAGSVHEKVLTINEIFQSYLDRDITPLIPGSRSEAYTRLIRLLAGMTGKILNLSNLANDTRISVPTIQKYLWLAEQTFFIRLITPYTANVTKEITKSPVVYFKDHGMRNFSISAFGNLQHPGDFGFVFQNMVCMILLRELHGMPFRLHFWRTTDKAEVDFIIARYKDPIPVEVKFAGLKQPAISRSLRSFIDKYKPGEAWMVNLILHTEIRVGATVVRFIPYALLREQIKAVVKSIETVYLAEEKSFPYRILRH